MKMFLKVITMTAWIMGVIFFKMIIMSNIVKINPVKLKKLHDIVFFMSKKLGKNKNMFLDTIDKVETMFLIVNLVKKCAL